MTIVDSSRQCSNRAVLVLLLLLSLLSLLGCRSADAGYDELLAMAPPIVPETKLTTFGDDAQTHDQAHEQTPEQTHEHTHSKTQDQTHDQAHEHTHSQTPDHGHASAKTNAVVAKVNEVVAGDVTMRAAMSHSLYNQSVPDHLVLKVDLRAEAKQPHKRQPLNLALVFDRSGSMADENKFMHSMQAANMVFENLSDHDIVSLIAFNDVAVVLSPAGRAVNKDFLRNRLRQFGPTGKTNLSAALLEAFAQIDSKSADGQMKRVIVLTDGMANIGVTDPEKLRMLVAAAHKRGIGVSTLGCGTEFSEKVLTNLAKAGGGRYTYVRSGELIPDAVAAELDGLLDVVAQNAKLEISVASGAQITQVYGRPIANPTPVYTFELGDIRDEERGSFLVELKPNSFEDGSKVRVDVKITLDSPRTGTRDHYTVSSEATFTKSDEQARKSGNENVLVYVNVLNAMGKAEEAIQGLDVERFKEARGLFDRYYEAAHKYAIDTRDQQLLNQTFLLRQFMAELSAASERSLIHSHDQARRQIKKESDYQRYLLEHHRPKPAP